MMTVVETDYIRRIAEKGRSSSFCVPGHLPITLTAAYSSNDLSEKGGRLDANNQLPNKNSSIKSASKKIHLQVAPKTRRSQSCRVSGTRPPLIYKRQATGNDTGQGSEQALDRGSSADFTDKFETNLLENSCDNIMVENIANKAESSGLQKVESCGRLVNLSTSEITDGPPNLRRSASARRPKPQSSANHSPISVRGLRTSGTSSMKVRNASRKGLLGSIKRPSPGYLDIHINGSAETLDTDEYLLRNFSTTNKGIINRGDSFRRRRSRSNSIQPSDENAQCILLSDSPRGASPGISTSEEVSPDQRQPSFSAHKLESFRVVILGAPGVGKTALFTQFRTSECINAYDFSSGDVSHRPISIVLNNIESEILFVKTATQKELQDETQRQPGADGWLIMYSITDRPSFQKASEELEKLHSAGKLKGKAVIIAGNKCELVRSRTVPTEDGKDLACSFNSKFMEISVGINHKCDDLLVGILHQLRLKEDDSSTKDADRKYPWKRNRSFARASMKAKKLVNRIIGKSESKYKTCEDFLI